MAGSRIDAAMKLVHVHRKLGGRLIQDKYPSHYMPGVGRQVAGAYATKGFVDGEPVAESTDTVYDALGNVAIPGTAAPSDEKEPARGSRILEGFSKGFGHQPLGFSEENKLKYPLTTGTWQPFVAPLDAAMRLPGGIAGAAAGAVGAGTEAATGDEGFANRAERQAKEFADFLMIEAGQVRPRAPTHTDSIPRGGDILPRETAQRPMIERAGPPMIEGEVVGGAPKALPEPPRAMLEAPREPVEPVRAVEPAPEAPTAMLEAPREVLEPARAVAEAPVEPAGPLPIVPMTRSEANQKIKELRQSMAGLEKDSPEFKAIQEQMKEINLQVKSAPQEPSVAAAPAPVKEVSPAREVQFSSVNPKGNILMRPSVSQYELKGPETQTVESFLNQIKGMPGISPEIVEEIALRRHLTSPELDALRTPITKAEFEKLFPPSQYNKVDLKNQGVSDIQHYRAMAENSIDAGPEEIFMNNMVNEWGMPQNETTEIISNILGNAVSGEYDAWKDIPREARSVLTSKGIKNIDDLYTYYDNILEKEVDKIYNEIIQEQEREGLLEKSSGYQNAHVQRLVENVTKTNIGNYFELGVTHPDSHTLYKHFPANKNMVGHFRGQFLSGDDSLITSNDKSPHIKTDPNSMVIEEIQSDVQKDTEQSGATKNVHATVFKAAIQHALENGVENVYYPTSKIVAFVREMKPSQFASIYDQEIVKYGLDPLLKIPGVTSKKVGKDYIKLHFSPDAIKYILEGPGQRLTNYAKGGVVNNYLPPKNDKSIVDKAMAVARTAGGRIGYANEGAVRDPNDPLGGLAQDANDPNQWLQFGGQDQGEASKGVPISEESSAILKPMGVDLPQEAKTPLIARAQSVARLIKSDQDVSSDSNSPFANFIPRDNPQRSKNFDEWFGDSLVKNKDGTPKTVYHGTSSDFSVFRPSSTGEFGPGIYATDLADEASSYAGTHPEGTGQNVMPVHIRMEQPFVAKDPSDFWEKFGGKTDADAIQNARKAGYDGVIIERPYTIYDEKRKQFYQTGKNHTHYVVFDPGQIKSAIGNSGKFSLKDLDINKNEGGKVQAVRKGLPERARGGSIVSKALMLKSPSGSSLHEAIRIAKQHRGTPRRS
jgi:hypothetical protein